MSDIWNAVLLGLSSTDLHKTKTTATYGLTNGFYYYPNESTLRPSNNNKWQTWRKNTKPTGPPRHDFALKLNIFASNTFS